MAVQKELIVAEESYPSMKPAMRIRVPVTMQYMCGDIHTGSTLVAIPFSAGTLESVGDFEPKLKFNINNGIDWFRIDNDKTHGRLSVKAIATDSENRSICIILDGLTPLNEVVMPLILGDPNAKTSPFGFAVEHMRIETGHDIYKPLEGMLFAASQRFAKDSDGGNAVDLRISRIIPGSGLE